MSLTASRLAHWRPNDLALADERQRITWNTLDPLVNRIVNGLRAAGLSSEGRAAVFASNCVENALVYIGALEAGVSTVPINFHLTVDELTYILRDSQAEILFVGPDTQEVGQEAAAKAGVKTVVGWRCEPRRNQLEWGAWLDASNASEATTTFSPRPHLHYTSGTTGQPKGTETPPNMLPATGSVADMFDALSARFQSNGARSPMMIVGPMYHSGPLNSVRSLGGGAALVILSRFDPETVLKTIEEYRIQAVGMVPTHFQRLLALPEDVRNRYDISSLRIVSHTGSACPRNVKQAMIDWFGPVLVEDYGGSESGATNRINSEDWLRRPGSVGRTLPPFEALILDENAKPLPAGQEGRIYFRDTTGRGIRYHNDEEKTRAAHLSPGIFTLGEIGFVDDEGFLFITDRASDMIVSGGVNIYPAEIEKVLIQHPQILDVSVVGVPNADMGEEVRAIVVPRSLEQPPATDELTRFCRKSLAGYKCPRGYDFVPDIGRNAMGKINKKELRQRYWPTTRTIAG
ncbi:long-chain acyl-CoA synthetase [Sphingobium sp. AP50]|uniref:AMP-binding protein n=1 Tax=Sphingobium sp. AP50 TaxID=1884369 RepID=UPI0008B5A1A1|nr:AMP-binding protein [Sphingobium sp. AP50]SEJ66153.1 long-chain acyl-CoA synthetase [Sphingobium sp. AP50]